MSQIDQTTTRDEPTLSTSDIVAGDAAGDRAADEPSAGTATDARDEQTPLLPGEELESFQTRWQEIQTTFVDSPQEAVQRGDALVAELMQRLAQTFADERGRLETQWGEGENVGTEELRVALQRYRSFFQRLLST